MLTNAAAAKPRPTVPVVRSRFDSRRRGVSLVAATAQGTDGQPTGEAGWHGERAARELGEKRGRFSMDAGVTTRDWSCSGGGKRGRCCASSRPRRRGVGGPSGSVDARPVDEEGKVVGGGAGHGVDEDWMAWIGRPGLDGLNWMAWPAWEGLQWTGRHPFWCSASASTPTALQQHLTRSPRFGREAGPCSPAPKPTTPYPVPRYLPNIGPQVFRVAPPYANGKEAGVEELPVLLHSRGAPE